MVPADRGPVCPVSYHRLYHEIFLPPHSFRPSSRIEDGRGLALALEEGKYAYLKGKLMEVYGLTDEQKADRLLDLSGLGDWKPSQLCAHMQGLAVN